MESSFDLDCANAPVQARATERSRTLDFIGDFIKLSINFTLKKLKLNELIQQGHQNLIFLNIENLDKLKKAEILDIVMEHYKKNCFDPVTTKKTKTASETDLISIGKRMKDQLNELDDIQNIQYAVIENQISPIATRMKTVQGMLAQYFIMLNDEMDIEFVSSSHKLKQFSELKIDNREKDLVQILKTKNIPFINENLDIGDFLITDNENNILIYYYLYLNFN